MSERGANGLGRSETMTDTIQAQRAALERLIDKAHRAINRADEAIARSYRIRANARETRARLRRIGPATV